MMKSSLETAYMPGRFSPPTRGHIQTMLWLLERFDRLVLGIGSCYEVGTVRHPLLASIREKMVLPIPAWRAVPCLVHLMWVAVTRASCKPCAKTRLKHFHICKYLPKIPT